MYRVITVEKGERVIIDDKISVCVTKTRGRNEIALGIKAPPTMMILKSELKNDARDNSEDGDPTGLQ